MSFNHSIKIGISVKNTEVHADMLHVSMAIKLSDTNNAVGTDVNLFILLSKLSHYNNA